MENVEQIRPIKKGTRSARMWAQQLYIAGFLQSEIAELLGVTERTIRNYKQAAGNWDELRVGELVRDKNGRPIYDNFKRHMDRGIAEISENPEYDATQKAAAIAKLADSYAKLRKIADIEDPTVYKLNVAKAVIEVFMKEIAQLQNDELHAHFREWLETGAVVKALEAARVI